MPDNGSKKEERSLTDILRKANKVFYKPDSNAMRYSGLGIQLAAVILIFLFIGVWLDKVLNTGFIFTLVLTFLGFAGGFYSFYLSITRLSSENKKNQSKKS